VYQGTVSLNNLGGKSVILCTEKRAPKPLVKRPPESLTEPSIVCISISIRVILYLSIVYFQISTKAINSLFIHPSAPPFRTIHIVSPSIVYLLILPDPHLPEPSIVHPSDPVYLSLHCLSIFSLHCLSLPPLSIFSLHCLSFDTPDPYLPEPPLLLGSFGGIWSSWSLSDVILRSLHLVTQRLKDQSGFLPVDIRVVVVVQDGLDVN